ncbi:MAG: CHAT domain-containing protein, partial [Thermoanaerobaculia bacterium]
MKTRFEYEDFALRIDEQSDGFRVRLVRSPYGPREERFIPPFSPREQTALLDSLAGTSMPVDSRTHGGATRDLSPVSKFATFPESSPESIGDKLFRSLFEGKIRECFLRSLSHMESLPGTGVRIRLELDPTKPGLASLAALPWELMYRDESRDFLSRNLTTPVVRYFDVAHLQTAPPPIREELRIVVLLASPEGSPRLDQEGELARIESAWGARGDIRIIQPERPTLRALRAILRQTAPHVFHFIGHGTFDPATGHGGLLLEDDQGRAHPVTGRLLAETLKIGHQIRLVFLNSCEGARLPRREAQDPYHGVASALLRGGVASVLAM